jgi:hypothetical protein
VDKCGKFSTLFGLRRIGNLELKGVSPLQLSSEKLPELALGKYLDPGLK